MVQRRATLKEVALEANVSVATASRALANHPAISAETQKKVRAAADRLGYVPNLQARSLRSSRSTAIGLSIPSMANPYFAEMANAVELAAAATGYSTVIACTNEDSGELDAALQTFSGLQLAGMIIVPAAGSGPAVSALAEQGQLIVQVDRLLADLPIPSVVTDPRRSITEAVTHLRQRGHRRVGYLAGPQTTSTGVLRLECFNHTCQAYPDLETVVYPGGYLRSEGQAGTKELLNAGITALIAGDSMMTTGALEACYELGVQPGRDLALIGFDDQPAFRIQPAPLTVIDQNVSVLGERAWAMLLAMINGAGPQPDQVLPTCLRIRASSDFSFHHMEVNQ